MTRRRRSSRRRRHGRRRNPSIGGSLALIVGAGAGAFAGYMVHTHIPLSAAASQLPPAEAAGMGMKRAAALSGGGAALGALAAAMVVK